MSLPNPIIQVLLHFRPAFTRPTWDKALVLVVGTILARGRRTVTAALKQMGLHDEPDFTLFHQVLNRASWSCLTLSRLLLQLLVSTFVEIGGTVEIVIDETLERRWGRRISKRGHYRDSVQSSKEQSVSTSGLRWVVMMLVVQVPWSSRAWALPFFSVLAATPKVSKQLGKPHKTVGEIAQQMVMIVRRWLPDVARVPISLVGDTAYSILELGLCCVKHNVTLVAPMRWECSLHEPAPSRGKGTIGRPRVKGAALPKLSSVLTDHKTEWVRVKVRWYDGSEQELELASGMAVWYRIGSPVLPIRWVLTRDPQGGQGNREPSQEPTSARTRAYRQWKW